MRLEYDPRGDIAYIQLSTDVDPEVHHTERVGTGQEYERGIDFDQHGEIVGYEFMNASRGLELADLPHRDQIAAFIASVSGLRVLSYHSFKTPDEASQR
jgi:uncharacterized protein YuzE